MIRKDKAIRQIHIRLPSETYRKLKIKCVSEDTSVQEYVAEIIDASLHRSAIRDEDVRTVRGDRT